MACRPAAPASVTDTPASTASTPAGPQVDAQRMLSTIEHLASDALAGRYTLAPEIGQAADYLAQAYREAGLEPVGEDFVVPYALTIGAKLEGEQKLSAQPARGRALTFEAPAFTPLPQSASAQVKGELVFVGYAASSDPEPDGQISYDDLAGVDVKGKVVLAFTDAPNTPDLAAFFGILEGIAKDFQADAGPLLEAGDEAAMRKLHEDAREEIAQALEPFMRGQALPKSFREVADPMASELDIFSLLGPVMEMARELPGPRFSTGGGRMGSKLTRLEKAGAAAVIFVRGPRSFIQAAQRELDPLPELISDPPEVMGEPASIPVVQMRWHDAERLFKAGGLDLSKTQAKIDESLEPRSKALKIEVELETKVQPIRVQAPNVLARIPGTTRADELVLFGAHFDHIGNTATGDCRRIDRTGDEICNGADDNASGTAMVLEIARAIAQSGQPPERTLLFASFSGEELGLLGSEAMAAAPPFERDQVVAMVNLDMVGRLSTQGLAIGGLSSSDDWMPLLDEIGTKGMEVVYERSITSRSDHANWFTHEIPVLFFFTGLHADYHRAGDHVEEINVEGMQSIGELVLDIAAALASGRDVKWREPEADEGLVGRLPGSDESTIEKRVEAEPKAAAE